MDNKILTLDDLIAKKIQRDKDKFKVKEIHISGTGKAMFFKKISERKMLDMLDRLEMKEDSTTPTTSSAYDVFTKLIYESCDALHDTKLHEKLEIVDPYDTVEKIFTYNEVLDIGSQLLELNNIGENQNKIKKY